MCATAGPSAEFRAEASGWDEELLALGAARRWPPAERPIDGDGFERVDPALRTSNRAPGVVALLAAAVVTLVAAAGFDATVGLLAVDGLSVVVDGDSAFSTGAVASPAVCTIFGGNGGDAPDESGAFAGVAGVCAGDTGAGAEGASVELCGATGSSSPTAAGTNTASRASPLTAARPAIRRSVRGVFALVMDASWNCVAGRYVTSTRLRRGLVPTEPSELRQTCCTKQVRDKARLGAEFSLE